MEKLVNIYSDMVNYTVTEENALEFITTFVYQGSEEINSIVDKIGEEMETSWGLG